MAGTTVGPEPGLTRHRAVVQHDSRPFDCPDPGTKLTFHF